MSGGWQLIVVGVMVTGAVGYLVRRCWRSWRLAGQGCGGGCGCASTKAEENPVHFLPAEQLTLRTPKEDQEKLGSR